MSMDTEVIPTNVKLESDRTFTHTPTYQLDITQGMDETENYSHTTTIIVSVVLSFKVS